MTALACVCAVVPMAIGVALANTGSFQYIFPLPGSSSLSPATNIIIRPGPLIDPSTIVGHAPLVVQGSSSGRHSGTSLLSDDARTFVFNPDTPFARGELVSVVLNEGIRTVSGSSIDPIEFSFRIRPIAPRPVDRLSGTRDFASMRPLAEGRSNRTSVVDSTVSPPDSLPADFPKVTVLYSDNPTPGVIFLSSTDFDPANQIKDYLLIINNQGYPVSYHAAGTTNHDFELQPNGMFTFWLADPPRFVESDTSYTPVATFTAGDGCQTGTHEIRFLPNGHTILIGIDTQAVRMDTIVAGGDSNAIVIGNIIQELDQSHNVVFQWRSWDHFNITDAPYENLTEVMIDYVHMNAIDIDTDGNLLLSSRNLSEITKIDRQTGEIIWRWGGVHNQFSFVNDTIGFSYQHAVRRIANGHITMFDNGNFHSTPFSRALEYDLDERTKVATLVWQYRHTPDLFSDAMGYVQRLDNGNTLIGWGATNPSVTEVRPDGSVTLELTLPPGQFSYKAIRYPWPPASTVFVAEPVRAPGAYRLDQNYPNPFNPSTTISYVLPHDAHATLTIFDVVGRVVATLVNEEQKAGYRSIEWAANNLPSGIYFYRLDADGFSSTRKMVLVK